MRISDWSSDVCSSDLLRAEFWLSGSSKCRDRNGTGTRQFSATLARHGILSPREVCSQNLSTYPKAIKIVGLMLHHFDALVPVTPSSICASNEIGRAQSELQSLMRISYAVFCLKKKINSLKIFFIIKSGRNHNLI